MASGFGLHEGAPVPVQISAQRKEIGRNSILLIEKDGDGENIILGNGGTRQC